ncbi:MAG TPA: glycosyltransferase family 4 protein [Candidatus Eremiobacteraceae bacterium]|nr:glycosyltransferase family 4 protein [Candidatus Eremiobacteraceae bacterium]
MARDPDVTVMHLVEASGGGEVMYGKERVIHWLMRAQRDAGDVDARLAVLAPCSLAATARDEGFRVDVLSDEERTLPTRVLRALRDALDAAKAPVLHTHGYKANIVGRFGRTSGLKMAALIGTCHGFVTTDVKLRLYNALDRMTGGMSDLVTAPDPGMLRSFGRGVRTRFVPNAIADGPATDEAARTAARATFGWRSGEFVAGMLGRLSAEKGVDNFANAARLDGADTVRWAVAGSGPLEAQLRASAPINVTCLGFLAEADAYLDALDIYVQPSFTEGLSLSLLEAMRAGLPIVATNVGATSEAVRDGVDALLVAPDPESIFGGVRRLRDDDALRARLGESARRRFLERFRMSVVERQYAAVYREAVGIRRAG